MKKIFALMLALTLLISLIPMNAAAVGHWSTYGGATPANDGSGNMILTKWTSKNCWVPWQLIILNCVIKNC